MGVRFTHALSKIQLPLTVSLLILSPLVFSYQRDSSTLLDLKLCLSQELSSCLSTAFHSGTWERMKDDDEDVGLLRLNGICSSQALFLALQRAVPTRSWPRPGQHFLLAFVSTDPWVQRGNARIQTLQGLGLHSSYCFITSS